MGRAPCCEKMGLKKGPWSPEEDKLLVAHIEKHGHGNWRALPKLAGLLRCGKSCRLRWINYLRPNIKRGNFAPEEEEAIINLHEMLGNRWSAIAARLPGRTDNEIKNVWHTHLKKRLKGKPLPTSVPESAADRSIDAPTSPQASSEVTSSSDLTNEMADAGHVEIKSEETYPFPASVIDESFWSEDLDSFSAMDDNNNILSNSSSSSSDFVDMIELPGQRGLNSENDVDFWYDLLLRTGGVPEFGL